MQLSQISLAITRLGGVPFGPAALFAAGEQGAWYDPSDLTTLFQDSAGTTPVTAVEQSVGLMLDKSKGLVLGSELVTNGGPFTATTGWTGSNATLSVSSTNLRVTNSIADGGSAAFNAAAPTIGQWYKVQFTIVSRTVSQASRVFFGGNIITGLNAGTYTYYLYATTTGAFTLNNGVLGVASEFADYTNIFVKSLAGNHAYQSTSTSRPVLRARYNLLTYSEQFDNAAWLNYQIRAWGSGSVANATTAPDGTTTADLVVENNTTDSHVPFYISSSAAPASYTYSVYAKPYSGSLATRYLALRIFRGPNNDFIYVTFDLASVAYDTKVGSASSFTGVSASITQANNGFLRCVVNFTNTVAFAAGAIGAQLSNVASPTLVQLGTVGAVSYAGDNTSGIYIWGAQLIVTNSLPSNTYQRIAAATDYNTTGFLPYLAFDGTDDSLLTNSVNFTATDKMTVWAGVRKLSDATGAIIAELGNASAGGWIVIPGNLALGTGSFYTFLGRGSAAESSTQAVQATPYAAPITAVLAATGDISGDLNTLRVNTVAGTNATGDQGTGNYGNFSIFIGRRNNATLPFNGNLYSLIIRGAQSSAAQISSTETWVAQKTGVTL